MWIVVFEQRYAVANVAHLFVAGTATQPHPVFIRIADDSVEIRMPEVIAHPVPASAELGRILRQKVATIGTVSSQPEIEIIERTRVSALRMLGALKRGKK